MASIAIAPPAGLQLQFHLQISIFTDTVSNKKVVMAQTKPPHSFLLFICPNTFSFLFWDTTAPFFMSGSVLLRQWPDLQAAWAPLPIYSLWYCSHIAITWTVTDEYVDDYHKFRPDSEEVCTERYMSNTLSAELPQNEHSKHKKQQL